MNKAIEVKKMFKEVTQSPKFKKYFWLGGLLHLIICITTVIEFVYPLNIEVQSIRYQIFTGCNFLVLAIISFLFFGFWINTIKVNFEKETNEYFELANLMTFKNVFSGFVFYFVMFLPQILLILVCIPIGIAGLIATTIGIMVFNPSVTAPGSPISFIFWFLLLITICAIPIFAMLLFIILYPQIVSNYLNKGIISTCNLKQVYQQIKNNFKTSFKVSTMTVVFCILSMIPFFGFYFELVWAKMFANYAKLNKKEI